MTGPPEIAMVIPTTERWDALARCLQSLVPQAEKHQAEIICVANSRRPEMHRAPSYPWVRYVHEPERSVGRARNRGAAEATARWVAYTDDDCVAPPGWLDALVSYIRSNPDIHIAGGAVIEPDRKAGRYRFMRELNYMRAADAMKIRPTGVPSLGAANLLVRRSTLLSLGGFDPQLATTEDYELLIRAQEAGLGIGHYLWEEPVIHAHQTSPGVFCRRYWRYGRGVAAVVMKHRLDPVAHGIYSSKHVSSLPSAIREFHSRDVAWIKERGGRLRGTARAWGVVRATAWQAGAWAETRLHDGGDR